MEKLESLKTELPLTFQKCNISTSTKNNSNKKSFHIESLKATHTSTHSFYRPISKTLKIK